MEQVPVTIQMAVLGAAIGFVLGFTARAARFCTLSAVETAAYGDNWVQIRMWVMAIAVAAAGTLALSETKLIDLSGTVHHLPRFAILGPALGGLLFGLGMAAVGTCSFGAVLRAAGGDLRGLIVTLVVGLVGYMTIRGLFAPARLDFIEPISVPLADGRNATVSGLVGGGPLAIALSISAIAGMALWAVKDHAFRSNYTALIGSVIVGVSIPVGWFVTGYIGNDDFHPQPVGSATFVAASSDTVMYLMTYTGDTIGFNVGLFLGVVVGGFLAAWRKSELRLEGFDDTREMRRHLIGACLMGVGGVLAMGCSIGQGLTGVSTLALPSFLALFSMWGGALLGLTILFNGWRFLIPRRH